jgi:cell shape-determining protein MreC
MNRRPTTPPLRAPLVALAAALVLAAALLRAPLGGALWGALEPLVRARDSLSASEVAELRAQLASTTAALADYDLLKAQNARLRAQLGRAPAAPRQALAQVLMRPPGMPYDTLMVDAGASQGVVVGDTVTAGALAIGVIDEVYAGSSRVVLYSAPGQSYDATLVTKTASVPVAVAGQGGGSLAAHVPAATPAAVGDTVVLSGLDSGMMGTVSAVAGADTDTFKTIYLRLPVNLFDLREVYIQL